MAFWGVEIKPGKPFTHSRQTAKGRLRISQATLGLGNASKKSIVQCIVGKKSPVLLCVLLPDKTESSHLDLEFEEADDVVFSVIGPRSVYLTGYYVRQSQHSSLQSDTESYGEDVGDTQTEESSYCSCDDKYEDSFIDDGELQVSPPSPASSSNEMDDTTPENDKPKDGKSHNKRLKNKYQVIESDSDAKSHESEDDEEDGFLLSVFKNKRDAKKSTNAEEKNAEVIVEMGDVSKDNGICNQETTEKVKPQTRKEKSERKKKLSSKDELIQVKNESPMDNESLKENVNDKVLSDDKVHENQDMPMSDGKGPTHSLDPEVSGKPKKKRKERSKIEEKLCESETAKDQSDFRDGEKKLSDSIKMEDGYNHFVHDASPELGSENGQKSKKRKKEIQLYDIPRDGELNQGSLLAGKSKKVSTDDGESHEKIIDNNTSMKTELQANDTRPEKKTKKSKKKKDQSTVGLNSTYSVQSRTLSNGLTIEELANGPPDGKIAESGKKVKIFYTAMLKENGHVFDTNVGKNPLKFRLGDKEINDGWNIGIDGMSVGDKRRLIIPPSMGFGNIGAGENVPPNSWIVYDVELVGVRK